MTWIIWTCNKLLVIQLMLTTLMVWLHFKCKEKVLSKDVNVLMHLNSYLCLAVLIVAYIVTSCNLIWSLEVHLSLSQSIVFIELAYFFLELTFLLACLTGVMRIFLAFYFDRIHSMDPGLLANKLLAGCVGASILPTFLIGGYHLYCQKIVHPGSLALMGIKANVEPKRNLSICFTLLYFAAAIVAHAANTFVTKWHLKRNVSQAIKMAEKTSKKGQNVVKKTTDNFSVKHVLSGLIICLFFVVFIVNRNRAGHFKLSDYIEKHVVAYFVCSLIMGVTLYFSLSEKVKALIMRRGKPITKKIRIARSTKVAPASPSIP